MGLYFKVTETNMQFKEEIIINTKPSEVFEKYKNVASWSEWDSEVKEALLEGEFKTGSVGVLIPTKGPKAKFKLTEVTLNKSFTSQTKLPLCVMEFSHTLKKSGGSTKVIHSVSFSGIASFIFSRVIGQPIKKTLPETLKGLKKICE